MSHITLINGASHSISSAKTIINGTGYNINSGKTLVNGTIKNISFVSPKSWHWNNTLITPASNIIADRDKYGAYFGFSITSDPSDTHKALHVLTSGIMNYQTTGGTYYQVYNRGSWNGNYYRSITFDLPPEGELLAYLLANATPIYD